MGSFGKRLKRELRRPFKRMGAKIKTAAQGFVIKTVNKQIVPGTQGSNASNAAASWDSSRIDSLLLAFIRSGQRYPPQSTAADSFQAVSFGSDRLLVGHPHVEFVLTDTDDCRVSALMAIGRFEPSLTVQLESNIRKGQCVYVIGDQAGFHALTASKLVGTNGRVVCLDEDASGLRSLNFSANQICNATVATENCELENLPSPSTIIARIEGAVETALDQLEFLAGQHPQASVILHASCCMQTSTETHQAIAAMASRLSAASRDVSQCGLRLSVSAEEPTKAFEYDDHEPLIFTPCGSPAKQSKAA